MPTEAPLVPRLLRLDTAGDVAAVRALIVSTPIDPSRRGWAAILPENGLFFRAWQAKLKEQMGRFGNYSPATDLGLVQEDGVRGTALLGTLERLRWFGGFAESNLEASAAAIGAQLLGWTEAVSGSPPPVLWRQRRIDWSAPLVMGVVNVTPDSFSDGGQFATPDAAVAYGLALVAAGADVLDVGGESTRPAGAAYGAGAQAVSDSDEIARVVPVIAGLRAATDIPISIDTRKSAVARAALEAGADIVNDVTGLLHDPAVADVVKEHGAHLVLMHVPRDIEDLGHEEPSDDILGDVLSGLQAASGRAQGIPRERLLVDPGIGFGKTAAHNLYLLRHLEAIRALGYPVVVGASRKASIAKAAAGSGVVPPVTDRVGASVGAAVMAYSNGAHVLRVHDVKETAQALRVAAAIRGAPDAGMASS